MSIRKCPYCRAIIDEGTETCSNCGTKLIFLEDESIEEEIPGEKVVDEEKEEAGGEKTAAEEEEPSDRPEEILGLPEDELPEVEEEGPENEGSQLREPSEATQAMGFRTQDVEKLVDPAEKEKEEIEKFLDSLKKERQQFKNKVFEVEGDAPSWAGAQDDAFEDRTIEPGVSSIEVPEQEESQEQLEEAAVQEEIEQPLENIETSVAEEPSATPDDEFSSASIEGRLPEEEQESLAFEIEAEKGPEIRRKRRRRKRKYLSPLDRIKAVIFDVLFIAVLWLASLWGASRVLEVSIVQLITFSTFASVGFYFILLVLYFFFFFFFLGETLGNYIFSSSDVG